MSAPDAAGRDGLTVSEQGGALEISFMHREALYVLRVGADGRLPVDSGFLRAVVAEGEGSRFIPLEEFRLEEFRGEDAAVPGRPVAMLDRSAAPLEPDVADPAAEFRYGGALRVRVLTGRGGGRVLAVSGTLVPMAPLPVPGPEPADGAGAEPEDAAGDGTGSSDDGASGTEPAAHSG